jgi:F0F1-type ATP synthase membrane subunit b/b'
MPQFDLFCFSTQVFWVFILFFAFYFLFTQLFLPELANTLKLRAKRKNLSLSLQNNTKKVTPFSLFLLCFLAN